MSSIAGYMQMGSQPVAGRARAMHVCAAGASAAAATSHATWLADFQAKPATTRIAVPDANRTRRSRGRP